MAQLLGGLVDLLEDGGIGAAKLHDGGRDLNGVHLGMSGNESTNGHTRA